MIDPIFCGAKWYNATIWLGHGGTTKKAPLYKIDLEEIKEPSASYTRKKEMREMMQTGSKNE